MTVPILIALGGNAISPSREIGTISQQFEHTRQTVRLLADLVQAGQRLVITHGNGPQVGNALRRVELAAHEVYTLPLDICGADTAGGMGYMIAACLNSELARRGIQRTAATLITTVEVAADDPAFKHPTKPIGSAYTAERAASLERLHAWTMREVEPGRFKRVVPSPTPLRVIEIGLIHRLADAGEILICGGGGGVPVVRAADGELCGVEAVLDKDLTSALIAAEIGAEALVIATGVDRVALDFGTPTQRFVDRLSADEAQKYLDDGQFPEGSMGPKIEAALKFVRARRSQHARAVICDLAHVAAALEGKSGTQIVLE